MRRESLVLGTLLLGACATAGGPPAVPREAPPALPGSLRWVLSSAEYRALFHQTYRAAAERVAAEAARREPGTWAVAVDADETLISNAPYERELAEAGEAFTLESWGRWVERKEAAPLPGAAAFLERVRELGGRIAVVTNRDEPLCGETEENLRRAGLPFDVVLCRPHPKLGEKEPRWRAVERGTAAPGLPPLEIVLWIGDNIRDFPGLDQDLRYRGPEGYEEFGVRYFILPNPLYGSWEDNPPD